VPCYDNAVIAHSPKSQIQPALTPNVAFVSTLPPPTRAVKAPTGPLWIHEIKHDGFRIVARRIGAVVRLQTKQGYEE